MDKETAPNNSRAPAEDPFEKILEENAGRVDKILELYGDVVVKNLHAGRPGHEDDPETMLVSDTRTECKPFIIALVRTRSDDELEAVINAYRVD